MSKKGAFLHSLRPTLCLGKMAGIIYFEIGRTSRFEQVTTVLIYCTMRAIGIYYVYDYTVHFLSTIFNDDVSKLTRISNVVFTFYCGITAFAKLIYFYCRRNDFKKLLVEVDGLNGALHRSKAYSKYECLKMVMMSVAVLAGVDQLTYFLQARFFYYVAYNTTSMISLFLSFADEQIMRVPVKELHDQFCFINGEIAKAETSGVIRRVARLAELQQRAVRAASLANDLFGTATAIHLGVCFVMFTICINYIASTIVVNQEIDCIFLFSTYWAVVCLYIMFMIVKTWSMAEKEAHKTATYIHDIWNNLASRNEIDNSTKHLQLISLQLYNSRLNFTAYGFFPLDWTLLHKIVGAVTTYVVILIQFEISSSTKNSSS